MFEAVRSVIVAAALAHSVSVAGMVNTGYCESKFDRYTVSNPPYVGLFQLDPGMQRRFYARGYDNLYDPAQQANFVAEVIASGGQSNWPTWGRICY